MSKISNLHFFIFSYLLLIASYYLGIGGEFFGDDSTRIFNNSELNSLISAVSGKLRDRPLLMLSMWLDKIMLNSNPFLMRIESLFFHSVLGIVMIFFFQNLAELTKWNYSKKNLYALTLLFLLHPLNSQTLTTVIQRGVILSSMCGLFGIIFYIKFLNSNLRKYYYTGIGIFAAGMLFKSNIILLPLLLYALNRYSSHLSVTKKRFFYPIPYLLTGSLPVLFYSFGVNQQKPMSVNNVWDYFLIQAESWLIYLKLTFFPIGLKFLYDFEVPSHGFLNYQLLIWVIIICLIGVFFRKRGLNLISISVLGMILSLLPESGFFPIKHYAFEHRTYLYLIFLVFTITGFIGVKDIKHAKIYLVLIFLYFIVALQFRNREIGNYANWAKHVVANSYNYHGQNWKYYQYLIENGFYREVKDALNHQLSRDIPEKPLYELLAIMLELEQSRDKKPVINKMINKMRSGEFISIQNQKYFIDYMLRRLKVLLIEDEFNLLMEDYLSSQTRLFFNSSRHNDFIAIHQKYLVLAQTILNNRPEQSPEEIFNLLKIRAILKYYYGVADKGLLEDINRQAKKHNSDSRYTRLLELAK